MPSFKLYDYSEGQYFNVYPYPENFAFETNMLFNIEELIFEVNYSIDLHEANNLVSFYTLPENNAIDHVMEDVIDNVMWVSGEAVSAQYYPEEGYWGGSLENLDISSGYWVRMSDDDVLDGSGYSLNPGRLYNLRDGANLVSFPSTGSVDVSAGLPDDIEDHVIAILGEGYSTLNTDEGWVGSILDFEALHGYWFITDSEISFSYDLSSETLSRRSNPYKVSEKPLGFDVFQSTQQAFYFVDHIELLDGDIEDGDWLISYCDNVVSGSRQWHGSTVDIPVMGYEGNYETAGYCEVGQTPHFKLLKSKTQELISLHGNIQEWQSNGVSFAGRLEESLPLPSQFVMDPAYPNPFNPSTTISYGLPTESHIEVSIFDLRGQHVETLINQYSQAGSYSVTWDASNVSSGVYFVHFNTYDNDNTTSQIQKIMLVK